MTNPTPTLYRLTPIDDVEGLEDGWYIVKTTDGDAHEMLFDKKEWHGKYEPYAYLRPLPPDTQVLPPGMVAVSEEAMSTIRNALKSIQGVSSDEGSREVANVALTKLAQMGEGKL